MLSGGVAAGALLASAGTAQATNYEVTSTLGTNDDNNCSPSPGVCTLREAVLAASDSTPDTITFAAPVTGTISTDNTLNIFGGPLTITGPGADVLTIDAGDVAGRRVIYIAPTSDSVTISGLRMTRGNAGASTTPGGGILSLNADLTISNDAITDNTALSGGGIYTQGGTLTVDGSEITQNTASRSDTTDAEGGGILALGDGAVTIRNSTIAGNSATTTDPTKSAFGGGIRTRGFPGPPTTIESSTVSGNSVVGNTGTARGGGISNQTQSTVTPVLRNSIVSGNTATGTTNSGQDLHANYGTFDAEFSLVEDASDVTLNDTIAGSNLTGVDPLLGPLTDNGGPTATMAPGPTSPARDAGRSFCLETDQRGSPRPSDFAGTANSTATGADGTDMGAFETQGGTLGTPPLCQPVQPPPTGSCQGKTATIVASGQVVNGTGKRDVIVGTSARNVIKAGGGNDLVCAGGGDDTVLGGGGNDTLLGQGGKDTLKGQSGKDKLIGGPGRDALRGGPGKDLQRQ